jgi:membrane protein implicated in regulation of membrane protease activity
MGFGSVFILILGVVVWIAAALWPASVAKKKGYSFILFLAIAVVFSFLIALIIAELLKDKTETEEDKANDRAVDEEFRKEGIQP